MAVQGYLHKLKYFVKSKNKENENKVLLSRAIKMYVPVCTQTQIITYPFLWNPINERIHCSVVILSAIASQMTSVSIACSTVCSGADQRKHHRSEWLAFARGSHRRPVDSHYKEPVKRKMFPFDDVIMLQNIDVQRQLGLKSFGGNKQNQAELIFVCLFLNAQLIFKII